MRKRILGFCLVLIVLLPAVVSCGNVSGNSSTFEYWNDCDALTKLKDYVTDVTDPKSANFIPVADRIAVFDMDGTLCGELFPTYLEYLLLAYRCLDDPSFKADPEDLEVAQLIRDGGPFPSDMPMKHAKAQAHVFEGMTIKEFDNYVKKFLSTKAWGFEGMTYGESFYKPMIEVIDYLQDHEFKTYIVSGSDRFICRSAASDVCHIPTEQIIGMDVSMKAENQGDTPGLDYQFQKTDILRRGSDVLIKNLKMNKVCQIAQEIGKQPVLSFGNSSGDTSMHMYTITNNPYRSAAFMLIADDEERDYGNTEKTTALGEQWKENGFTVISMKNDFKTIYGYDVKKTA